MRRKLLSKNIKAAMKGNKLDKAVDLCQLITFQKPLLKVIALAQESNLRNLAEQMQLIHVFFHSFLIA